MDRATEEKIYAGVLGKIIGVYHGRPVEGWSYERIRDSFGEVDYFVNGKMNLNDIGGATKGSSNAAQEQVKGCATTAVTSAAASISASGTAGGPAPSSTSP